MDQYLILTFKIRKTEIASENLRLFKKIQVINDKPSVSVIQKPDNVEHFMLEYSSSDG